MAKETSTVSDGPVTSLCASAPQVCSRDCYHIQNETVLSPLTPRGGRDNSDGLVISYTCVYCTVFALAQSRRGSLRLTCELDKRVYSPTTEHHWRVSMVMIAIGFSTVIRESQTNAVAWSWRPSLIIDSLEC